jgi:hypothetical protein
MDHALAAAEARGHRAVLLLGDAPYYARFGFSAQKTNALSLPGPFERDRLLGLEFNQGAFDGASGTIVPTGARLPKIKAIPSRRRCVPCAARRSDHAGEPADKTRCCTFAHPSRRHHDPRDRVERHDRQGLIGTPMGSGRAAILRRDTAVALI